MISRYESSEREERGARKGGVLRSIRDSRERSQREQARLCRMRNFSLSLCVSLFLFCVAWLCRARLPACLPGMYTAQGGQWISLNDTKARELRLGMKPLTSHNLPLLQIKRHEKSEKNSFDLPSLSLLSPPFLRLSPRPSALVYAPFIVKPFLSRSTSSSSGCLS